MKNVKQYLESLNEGIAPAVNEKTKMNNLDWGKTTAERNKNLDHYDSLKTDKEKEEFLKKLKSLNEGKMDKKVDKAIDDHGFTGIDIKAYKKLANSSKDEIDYAEKLVKYHKENDENADYDDSLEFAMSVFESLNEGKNDKKIKELQKEIKSLKDENEEGYETEIKNLEQEIADLNESEDFAGWIAIFNGKKLEIDKSEAKDLWGAKQIAIKKLKVPKSKQGLLAIEPAVNENAAVVMNEGKRIKPFKKVKKGDTATDYNGETAMVVATGKVKDLLDYDDFGAADELDPNDEGIVLQDVQSGDTAVFSYDDAGAVVYESLTESQLGFDSGGVFVTNPFYDETGRSNVNPTKYKGYKGSDLQKAVDAMEALVASYNYWKENSISQEDEDGNYDMDAMGLDFYLKKNAKNIATIQKFSK
jgi:hypothetical protein